MANRVFLQKEKQKYRGIAYGVHGYCTHQREDEERASQEYNIELLDVGYFVGETFAAMPLSSPAEAAAKIEYNLRIAELERRVAILESANNELRAEVHRLQNSPERQESSGADDPKLADVVALTEQMFGTPEINVMCDPEDPSISFVVFTVKCRGEAKDIVARRIEWHDRVDAIPSGTSGRFRLSIVPLR